MKTRMCVSVCARLRVLLFHSSRCVEQRRFCCDEVNGREKMLQVRYSLQMLPSTQPRSRCPVMDGAPGSPRNGLAPL